MKKLILIFPFLLFSGKVIGQFHYQLGLYAGSSYKENKVLSSGGVPNVKIGQPGYHRVLGGFITWFYRPKAKNPFGEGIRFSASHDGVVSRARLPLEHKYFRHDIFRKSYSRLNLSWYKELYKHFYVEPGFGMIRSTSYSLSSSFSEATLQDYGVSDLIYTHTVSPRRVFFPSLAVGKNFYVFSKKERHEIGLSFHYQFAFFQVGRSNLFYTQGNENYFYQSALYLHGPSFQLSYAVRSKTLKPKSNKPRWQPKKAPWEKE